MAILGLSAPRTFLVPFQKIYGKYLIFFCMNWPVNEAKNLRGCTGQHLAQTSRKTNQLFLRAPQKFYSPTNNESF